jgi:hypothetical protein
MKKILYVAGSPPHRHDQGVFGILITPLLMASDVPDSS